MKVEVRLFATLRTGRFERAALELPDGACLRDVLVRLNIPEKDPLLSFVNGRHATLDHRLAEGDVLALFPPLAGG